MSGKRIAFDSNYDIVWTDEHGNANGRHYEGSMDFDLFGNPVPETPMPISEPSIEQTYVTQQQMLDSITKVHIRNSCKDEIEYITECVRRGIDP